MDCIPFIEAVGKLLILYLAEGMDIFKQVFQSVEWQNATYPKKHADLYTALKSQLIVCPFIAFSRLAIASETKIRSHQVHDPATCQKIIGLDANSLYL